MTVFLNSLFRVTYGNKLDLNKVDQILEGNLGVNFVGRSSLHHGVSARVNRIAGTTSYPAGCITVALGGSKLLASFVQLEEFYTAQNVAVLSPLQPMTLAQKIYVCLCIRQNRFRYSAFGREANRTLRTLPVPSLAEFPAWVGKVSADLDVGKYMATASKLEKPRLEIAGWSKFSLSTLFDIRKGIRLTQANIEEGSTPFISAIDKNNGMRQRVNVGARHAGNLITVSYNGSVGEAFYQPEPFFASDDVNVLYPKFDLTESIGLFLCAVIRKEAYRFSYGRKWTAERMRATEIRLPSRDGQPDWRWITGFMQSVPGSAILASGEVEAPVLVS